MKVRASVKRLCEFCYTVRRRGKLFVYCKKTPRHKQRQWFATEAAAGGEASSGAECAACAAPLAPSAPSFAFLPAATSTSWPHSLTLSGGVTGGGLRLAGGAATGGFTLGEVHRQAAMLLGGGGRRR